MLVMPRLSDTAGHTVSYKSTGVVPWLFHGHVASTSWTDQRICACTIN